MQKEHLIHLTLGIALTSIPLTTSALERCETPIEPECVHAEHRPIENVHFAYGATEDGEAWVARYDHRSSEPTWRTSIGGDGQQTVEAVALAKENAELLVAGGSTSTTLAGIAGSNNGGRDGYVLRLNVESGEVQAGTFVGGEGEELLTGVAEATDGHILLAGQSSDQLEDFGDPPARLTRVQKAPIGEDGTLFVFYEVVSPNAKDEKSRFSLGQLPVETPRIWIGCDGSARIGLEFDPESTNCDGNWPLVSYRMDAPANPAGGFGYHALDWKLNHANSTASPQYWIDWNRLPLFSQVPDRSNPVCTDADALNFLEGEIFLQGSVPADPSGGWSCGSHTNVAQLSLFSAFLHHRWGTPVYTTFGFWNVNSPLDWVTHPVAIEATHFEPICNPATLNAYQGERLEDLCDMSVNSVNHLTCLTSVGVPGVAATGFALKLSSFDTVQWYIDGGVGVFPYFDPYPLNRMYEWYQPGEYVFDPPDGSAIEVTILEAAARQLSRRVFSSGSVQLTRLEDGTETCYDEMEGWLPASE